MGDEPAVELDAVDPDVLTGLVDDAIEAIIDPQAMKIVKVAEEAERDGLLSLAEAWGDR